MDASPARVHLEQLQARGIGKDRVAALAGLSVSRVARVRSGELARLRTSTAAAILKVRPLAALGTRVPADRARTLMHWFSIEGFTLAMLAARLGLTRQTLALARDSVTLDTTLRLAAYRRALTE